MCVYIRAFFQILFPYRLLQNTEYSCLCDTGGLVGRGPSSPHLPQHSCLCSFFITIFIFFITAGLQCSVNFLLYSRVAQEHTRIHRFFFLPWSGSIICDETSFPGLHSRISLLIHSLHLGPPSSPSNPLTTSVLTKYEVPLNAGFFWFCFWPHPQHMEVPGPGIETTFPQRPKPLKSDS